MIGFVEDHREVHGLEPQSGSRPICKVLPIAPSTYRAQVARQRDERSCRPGRSATPH
jgi:hypothetical protein